MIRIQVIIDHFLSLSRPSVFQKTHHSTVQTLSAAESKVDREWKVACFN